MESIAVILGTVVLGVFVFLGVKSKRGPFDVYKEPAPTPIQYIPGPPAPIPVPAPNPVPEAQQRLYDAAYSCLGKNMTSPGVPTSLGCASSLNNVFKKAFGTVIGGGASTAEMFRILKADPRFREVSKPALGDIAMNASGTSTKGVPNGHVGIWGKNSVMSNNSLTGKWDAHYTLKGWVDFFEKKEGFKTRYFRVK